jgi:hypothetical protein
VNTSPTGVLVVLGADPSNSVLRDRYDAIVGSAIVPDPQRVPAAILDRHGAVDPERLLRAAFWPQLVSARNRGVERAPGYEPVRRAIATLAAEQPTIVPPRKPRAAEAQGARRTLRRAIPLRIRTALVSPLKRLGLRR